MKIINRNIFAFEEDEYLAAVRNKWDYINLILLASRSLSIEQKFKSSLTNCHLKLKIGKMSRIFIYKNEKFFSFAFPFNVILKNQSVVKIMTYSGLVVDSQSISSALSLLKGSTSIIQVLNKESDPETYHFDNLGKDLLEQLIMLEPSYLRYDKDVVNAKGNKHPVNHLDINFSSYGTYKIGLSADLLTNQFEDFINIDTDCFFLNVPK